MDYSEIVFDGYFNANNREYLDKYFFREYKKAEKNNFEANEFFGGCMKVIESWEKHLQDKVFESKKDLYLMLNGAKNGTLSYADLDGKTIEQKRKETVEYCEQELKDVRPDGIGSLSFTVHLSSLTNGRVAYNMAYNEVLQIKDAILWAYKKAECIDEEKFLTFHQIKMAIAYKDLINNSEKIWFPAYCENLRIEEKITGNLAQLNIEAELKKINDFEHHAENNLLNNVFDIYNQEQNKKYYDYRDEIQYLRIKANYYEKNPLMDTETVGKIYAKHIFLKAYLEKKLDSIQTESSNKKMNLKVENETSQLPYFSYVHVGHAMESKHQLKFNSFTNTANGKVPLEPNENELLQRFINQMYETDVNEIDSYLSFHYIKYPGEKINWWRYTKSRIEDNIINYDTNQKRLHPLHEFIFEWFAKNKEDKKSATNQQVETKAKDGVLTRDEYFKIILEIHELERITVGQYIQDKYEKLISKNPDFIICLYKDIYNVLDGVHNEGDLDLIIDNGDFAIEYGDLKVTGNPTNLDSALTWLHEKLVEGFIKKDPLKLHEQMDRFEKDFLKINYDTPAYSQKIAQLNQEIRNAKAPKTDKGKQKQTASEQQVPEIKPIFKPDAIQTILDLLKGFFSQDHQVQLEIILKSGGNANEKLIFLDTGNRLADAFKQLIKTDFITGCEQKELESWILKNFSYKHRQKIKNFTSRYLNDIISTNKDMCQTPILNVTKEKATGKYSITKA